MSKFVILEFLRIKVLFSFFFCRVTIRALENKEGTYHVQKEKYRRLRLKTQPTRPENAL